MSKHPSTFTSALHKEFKDSRSSFEVLAYSRWLRWQLLLLAVILAAPVYAAPGGAQTTGPQLRPPLQAQFDSSEELHPRMAAPISQTGAGPAAGSGAVDNRDLKARASALVRSGARLHLQGNDRRAEQMFREAIALDPQSVDAFFDLGALAEGRGDLAAALSDYQAGLALKPYDLELIRAVRSIRGRLADSAGSARSNAPPEKEAFAHPPRMFPNNRTESAGFSAPPVLPVSQANPAVLGAVPASIPQGNSAGYSPPVVNTGSANTPLLSTSRQKPGKRGFSIKRAAGFTARGLVSIGKIGLRSVLTTHDSCGCRYFYRY